MKRKPFTFEEQNGCWNCTSHHKIQGGYSQFTYRRKETLVHRYIFEECFGPIPDGLIVRHKCDNPSCINPEHLELGTKKDNCADMFSRGRGNRPKGERHHNVRLNSRQVLEIFNSPLTQVELGERYGVHFTTIGLIKTGKNWSWLTGGIKNAF